MDADHNAQLWMTAILTSFSEIRPRAEDPQGKIRPAILTSFSEISTAWKKKFYRT